MLSTVGANLDLEQCDALKRNASIPFNLTEDGALDYKNCLKYNVSSVEFDPGLDPAHYRGEMLETIPCDQGWVYDTSQYKSSIVMDVSSNSKRTLLATEIKI